MTDVHVLRRTTPGRYQLVMHFPVPAGNNAAGVLWSAVLVNSGLGGKTVLPDGDGTGGSISAAEKATIANGTIYEVVEEVDLLSAGASSAQITAYADALYTRRLTEVQAELQAILSQFGRTRDVP